MQIHTLRITAGQHRKILAVTTNRELRIYLEVLQETGGSPQDIWALTAESIDYIKGEIAYVPGKSAGSNSEPVRIPINQHFEYQLRGLPGSGRLFPGRDFKWVAKEFTKLKKRCHLPRGVTLQSYRISWVVRQLKGEK